MTENLAKKPKKGLLDKWLPFFVIVFFSTQTSSLLFFEKAVALLGCERLMVGKGICCVMRWKDWFIVLNIFDFIAINCFLREQGNLLMRNCASQLAILFAQLTNTLCLTSIIIVIVIVVVHGAEKQGIVAGQVIWGQVIWGYFGGVLRTKKIWIRRAEQ